MSEASTSTALRERLKSPLTWHLAGFAILLALAIGLGVRLGLDWTATNSRSNDVLLGKQLQLKTLQLQTAPLSGIDGRGSDPGTAVLADQQGGEFVVGRRVPIASRD